MKIGIIGAMPQEIEKLDAKLLNKKVWEEAGSKFYSGQINQHEVVLVQSGIGKVLAALTAALLISHYKVDILINTGSAGGIGNGLNIGDLVVSEKLAYFDVDVTAFNYEKGQMAGMPLYYPADSTLVEKTKKAAVKTGLAVKSGLIVSGDSFVHTKKMIQAIKEIFPDVLANEMEGTAIAQVAYQYQTPFVVIRAISDNGDEQANVVFDEFIVEAGEKSAAMVLALIDTLD